MSLRATQPLRMQVPGKEEDEGKEQAPFPPRPRSNRWEHCIKDTRIWIQKIWMEEEIPQSGKFNTKTMSGSRDSQWECWPRHFPAAS